MNVSGIRPGVGFYSAGSVAAIRQAAEIRQQAAVDTKGAAQDTTEEVDEQALAQKREAARAKQTFGAYDYANQYRPEDSISTARVGNIRSNDVERAISDMQKDNALHQYQYFVKEGGTNRAGDVSAVTLRGGEDFSL